VLNIVNINKKWFTWLFLLYLASFLISYVLSILNFNIFDKLPDTHKMKAQIIKIQAFDKTQTPITDEVKPTNTITPQIKVLKKIATILPIESQIIIETPIETKYIPIINKTPMITPTLFYTIEPTIVITPQPTINTIVPTIMPTIIPTLEPTIIIEDMP
jgi:hypothetical protein